VQELRLLDTKVGGVRSAVFNVEHNIQAMFYAKVTAYPFIPNQAQIDQAVHKGFRVFIYDAPSIPPGIRANTNVVILQNTFSKDQ
jgi:hypothetical protein